MEFLIDADAGQWRWRLEDRFAKVLAVGPAAFASKAECLVAIAAVKAALGAPVRDTPR
jgi:uncharacterized protein YegP (UPF0339 family)